MNINQIYNWDCIEILKWDTIENNSIDLILTDPPYKFESHGRWINAHRSYLSVWAKWLWTDKDTDIYTDEFMELLLKKLKYPNMIFFCNKAQILDILEKAKKYNLNFDILVLCKTAPTPLTNNQRLPDKEFAIHLFKWAVVKWNYKTKRTFRTAPNYKDTTINHPTVKPLEVIEQMILNCTNEWETVLDCYLWSWTTAVACKNTNRNYIWIEINPEYVEIAENRLKEVDRINQQKLF